MSDFGNSKQFDKLKPFFANLKQEIDKPIVKIILGTCVLFWVIVLAQNNNPPKGPEVIAPPSVSDADLQSALNKCILLEAKNIYETDKNMIESKLFDQAKTVCEERKLGYSNRLDEYTGDIFSLWEEKNNGVIAGKPLTYYLDEVKNHQEKIDGNQDGVAIFVSALQTINAEKRQAEETKQKAEAETVAKKQMAREAQANNQNNKGAVSPNTTYDTPSGDCKIKGNVNRKGEKIYHVPGGQYYNKTNVNPGNGDKFFCTEAEAQAAGFRRSKR